MEKEVTTPEQYPLSLNVLTPGELRSRCSRMGPKPRSAKSCLEFSAGGGPDASLFAVDW
jgi:hypothetical protein